MSNRLRAMLAVGLVVSGPLLLFAQRGGFNRPPTEIPPNPSYSGRFTYARIRYTIAGSEFSFRRDIKWAHDYPRSDSHFPKILSELTSMDVRTDSSAIVGLDDPELFRYPVVYLCEAGFWLPSEAEISGLRNYLLKGGFVLFDDFDRNQWYNFETQMRRALPDVRMIPLTHDHPIWDSFYRIESLDYDHPVYGMKAEFYGIFEDNDPTKRMMAIVNYNMDVSEYWEHSDEGFYAVDLTNVAYKLGVNYVIYTLSH